VLGRPIGERRGFAEWEHQQQLTDNLTLTAQLNYWKDSAILRDFRPEAFFNVQEPDTFAESVYTGKNYFVSAFVRYQPNSFQVVQQRLPEVRFDMLPLAVGNGSTNSSTRARRICARIRPRASYRASKATGSTPITR